MNKAFPSNKLYKLKTSKKSDSDFNTQNMSLEKNKESNIIAKFKLFSKTNIKPSRNFLPKPIGESKKEINKDFPYESHINYIFLYYEKTIEHLKQYKKINNSYNNISSIKNNFNNIKDKSINEEKNKILSNINTNISTNINTNINSNLNIKSDINNCKNINYLILNNSEVGRFCSNNSMEILYENKKRESKINEAIDDTKKLNVNISEEKSKDNLNENEIKNLIINIDYPPFKPSTLNNKKEDIKKDIKKSNIIPKSSSNTIFEANTNDNIRNEDYEYLIEMFGKKGWVCLLCNNFNYEKRIKCNRCGQLKKPKKISNLKLKMKKNQNEQKDNNKSDNQNKDWICCYCKNFNYSFRNICNRCKIPKTPQIIYNFNPSINNYIKCNYATFPAQPIFLFNNSQNIYINNIANFMYK